MNQEKNGIWTSWNDNITSNYDSLYKITSEKELQEVVKKSKKIRKYFNKEKKFNTITNIKVANDRIFITDVFDSVHMIKYNKKENSFVEISDTILSCYTSSYN